MPEDTVSRDAVVPSVPPPSVPGEGIDPLEAEKTRKEIEKLGLEIQEQKAWRWKILLTTLTPIGSVLLFLIGWHRISARSFGSDRLPGCGAIRCATARRA